MSIEIKNNNVSINKEVLFGTTVIQTLVPGQAITVRDASAPPPPPPTTGTLAPAVAAWNAAHAGDHVVHGGLDSLAGVSPPISGNDYTFFALSLTEAIRQIGVITAAGFNFASIGGTARLQLWRRNSAGTVLTLVEETATFTPSTTGETIYSLPTPFTLQQPGDIPGIWVDGCTLRCLSSGGPLETGWIAGHPATITLADIPTSAQMNRTIGLTFYGPPPFGVGAGDSIDAGHGDPFFRPHLDGGPSGDPAGEPFYHVRAAVPGLTTQNFAKGSTGWEFAEDNIGKIDAVQSRFVLFGPGINDLSEDWATNATRMAACKAGLTHGQIMFVREITPDNAAPTGAVAARNALRATWCVANGAIVIPCHDAMAQIRTATGLLEDLKSAYDDGSGIHHNLAGKQKMAECDLAVLDTITY